MISIKKITTFLASLVVAGIVLSNSIVFAQQAQQSDFFCIPTYEQLIEQTEKRELLLAFVGVTRTGMSLWFFANATDFSVFFKDRVTGQYCTAPNYYGSILNAIPVED